MIAGQPRKDTPSRGSAADAIMIAGQLRTDTPPRGSAADAIMIVGSRARILRLGALQQMPL